MDMDNVLGFPQIIKECLGAFEVFRRLMFEPEEIFVSLDQLPEVRVLVQDGSDSGFCVTLGRTDMSAEQFAGLWNVAAEMWNAHMPEQQRQEIYQTSLAFKHGDWIISGLGQARLPYWKKRTYGVLEAELGAERSAGAGEGNPDPN